MMSLSNSGLPDDALTAAGLRQCPRCRRAAFPVDATWLDDRLILASFPRICAHIPAGVVSVCTCCIEENPEHYRPADAGLLLTGRRCAGRNRHQAPCRATAVPGSLYCHWHEPARHVHHCGSEGGAE